MGYPPRVVGCAGSRVAGLSTPPPADTVPPLSLGRGPPFPDYRPPVHIYPIGA
jgi:hypothetical protein